MTPVEHEYRYLVRRAIKEGNPALAAQLSEHALLYYDLVIPVGPHPAEEDAVA